MTRLSPTWTHRRPQLLWEQRAALLATSRVFLSRIIPLIVNISSVTFFSFLLSVFFFLHCDFRWYYNNLAEFACSCHFFVLFFFVPEYLVYSYDSFTCMILNMVLPSTAPTNHPHKLCPLPKKPTNPTETLPITASEHIESLPSPSKIIMDIKVNACVNCVNFFKSFSRAFPPFIYHLSFTLRMPS